MKFVIDIPDGYDVSKIQNGSIASKKILDAVKKGKLLNPCEEAISRQAAIGIIQNWLNSDTGYNWGEKNVMKCTIDELRDLPSVSTEKTGRWIIVDDCEKFIAKCSECGRIEDSRMINKYPYCHCGAKMEVKKSEKNICS